METEASRFDDWTMHRLQTLDQLNRWFCRVIFYHNLKLATYSRTNEQKEEHENNNKTLVKKDKVKNFPKKDRLGALLQVSFLFQFSKCLHCYEEGQTEAPNLPAKPAEVLINCRMKVMTR